MSSVDSKWCHFTADFTFCNKKKSQGARPGDEGGCGITVMSKTALNLASSCCSLRFLGTIWAQIFLSPNSSIGIKRKVSRFMLTSSAIILTVYLRSDRRSLLPVLCCHLPLLLLVIRCADRLQQRFCLQKTYCASEMLVLFTLHHLQRPADVFHLLW